MIRRDVKDRLLKANHNQEISGWPDCWDVKDRLLKANHNCLGISSWEKVDVKDRLLKANHNSISAGCMVMVDVKDRLLKANHNYYGGQNGSGHWCQRSFVESKSQRCRQWLRSCSGCQRSFVESKSQPNGLRQVNKMDVKDRLLKANHNLELSGLYLGLDVKDRLLKANHNNF